MMLFEENVKLKTTILFKQCKIYWRADFVKLKSRKSFKVEIIVS